MGILPVPNPRFPIALHAEMRFISAMNPIPLFHTLVGDSVEGPYTAGQLRALEESGVIHGQTPVSRQGEAEWLPLEVWREVIHGAPTHRGAITRSSSPTHSKSAGADRKKLAKAAFVLALVAMLLATIGLVFHGGTGWTFGLCSLSVAFIFWFIGACLK